MNMNENAKALTDDELVSVVGGTQCTVDNQQGGKAAVRKEVTVSSEYAGKLTNGTIVEKIDGIPPRKDPYSTWTFVKIRFTNDEGKCCEGWIGDSLIKEV